MQQARLKFSHGKIGEFRAILGRMLFSAMRNEFYIEISNESFSMYVYDQELHQVRLCATFETSFFEEIVCIKKMTFMFMNLREFFNVIGLSPFPVEFLLTKDQFFDLGFLQRRGFEV